MRLKPKIGAATPHLAVWAEAGKTPPESYGIGTFVAALEGGAGRLM
jgi:hypothetical protein